MEMITRARTRHGISKNLAETRIFVVGIFKVTFGPIDSRLENYCSFY